MVQHRIVAALFTTPAQAERAVAELRTAGVGNEAISIVTSSEARDEKTGRSEKVRASLDHDSKAEGILKGIGAGGAVGALAGLVALSIPGLGPFIAAGAIAEALGAAGSAAVVSGAIGATAGGLTGALIDYGIERPEAEHIERRLRQGAALVAVDTRDSARDYNAVRAVLRAAGGQTTESEAAAPAN